MKQEHKINLLSANIAVWSCVLIVASLVLTGCMADTGWQIQMGVHPINAINHNQQLGGVKSNGGAIVSASQKDRY